MRRGAVIALVLLGASGAAAQPIASEIEPEDPGLAEARAEFDRARELADARRFDEAAEAFARSLELAPRPSTMFNLGACYYALGRHVEAIAMLERYVAEADPAAEAVGLADAERMLAHARRSISELTIELVPDDARVTIDGAPLDGGATRTVRLDPGTHVIRAEAEGHAPALLEVRTARGETIRRALRLESTRRPAVLLVEAPEGARVRVDEREVNGPVELEPGAHAIAVEGPGLSPMTREVEVAANERLRVRVAPVDRARDVFAEPALWIGALGAAAAIGAGVLIGVLATTLGPSADGGTTGTVITAPALGARW